VHRREHGERQRDNMQARTETQGRKDRDNGMEGQRQREGKRQIDMQARTETHGGKDRGKEMEG
jgi:hypothetical protein